MGGNTPWLRIVLIVAVLLGGIGGGIYTWREESERVQLADEAAADRAMGLLGSIGASLDGSLAGAGAIVDEAGELDVPAYHAFAADLLSGGGITALAFEPVVPAAARAAFEARIGRPITDRPGDGAEPAPERDLYYPVLEAVPRSETTDPLIGFDILGDPVRAAAAQLARDTGVTVFSEPVPSEPTGTLSVFLVKAVYRLGSTADTPGARRADLVGFVSSAFASDRLGEVVALVLPDDASFELRDGDSVLTRRGGAVEGGVERTLQAAGREWVVVVEDGAAPVRTVPVLVVAVAGLVALGMLVELRRSQRTEEEALRTKELAHLAEGLATRSSSDDVMRFLTSSVLAPLGAMHAAVAVVEGNRLRRHFTPGDLTDHARPLLPDSVPVDADMPLANAARTGMPSYVPDVEALRSRYPRLVDGWQRLGFVATANLPLRDRNGQLLGALGVAWDHRVDFDRLRDPLTTVAGIAGQTIERARLADAEHRLSIAMQEGLLTPLPAFEGLEMAERYLPAVEEVGMGGDWYEGIVLDADRYLVVVGDVAGHGIGAVAQMAQLRSTIETIASLGTPLAEILPLASAQLQHDDVVLASAAVVEVDLAAGRVRYVCAGHPPPLLRQPDGSVVLLDQGRLPLLGIDMADAAVVGEHPFPPGSAVLCYTDGLVERRTEPIDESIRRLADIVAEGPVATAERLAGEVLDRCLGEVQDDDVVLTVLVNRRS